MNSLFETFLIDPDGDKIKVDEYITQAEKEQAKKTQKVLHGAKLNYLRNLKHQCAPDEEVVYYKKGGSVGCGCKKKEDGGEIAKAQKGNIVDRYKAYMKSKLNKAKELSGQVDGYKTDYSSKRVKDSEKDYLKGKADHKIKSNCGGSSIVTKFKAAKCGAKMKKK